jgi:hypothetical protein
MGNSQYYWRVTPVNTCGAGSPSVVYTFLTGASTPPPPPPPTDWYVVYLPMAMMEEN